MLRAAKLILAVVAVIAAFLVIPFLLKEPPPPPLVGPSLDQMEYQEIGFKNGALDLAGMLLLPDGDGPFPGAVFIHGSGTSRRDNTWYLTVADHLQSNGVAVLLPDKRGSEASGGDWRDTSFEELATDTQAAFEFLAKVPDIDADQIGLIGFSQGGWIAPVAASTNSSVAYVVSMSGAGVTTEEQLSFEEVNNVVATGTYRFLAELIAPITIRGIKQREAWRATAGFDPMPYWAKITVPVFAAFGAGDTNIPVEESVRRFNALPFDLLVKVYPDGGHAIRDPSTGGVRQAFLDDLLTFLRDATVN